MLHLLEVLGEILGDTLFVAAGRISWRVFLALLFIVLLIAAAVLVLVLR